MSMIGINVSVSGFTGKLLIRWLEASAPLSEVGRSAAFNFPYDAVYTIPNINPVVHIVQLWQSVDGTALSQLIKTWEIDAAQQNSLSFITYQYKVGRGTVVTGPPAWADPANLATVLADARLNGATQDDLLVIEAGYGPKANDEYALHAGGGIELLGGAQFNSGTNWFITRSLLVTTSTPPTTSPNEFLDIVEITGAINFYTSPTVNYYNKMISCVGSATVVQVTFPAFSTIPNNTKATFITHDGTQRYLKLQFNVGDTVKFLGQSVNVIYLGRGEEISMVWKGSKCYIRYEGDARRVGQRIWGDKQELNTVFRDGTQYLQADYPRLTAWVKSLPPAQVVTEAVWATSSLVTYVADGAGGAMIQKTVYPNKGMYAIDDVGGTIRVPDDRNRFIRAMKYTDTTDDTERIVDKPGGYQIDSFKSHFHKVKGKYNDGGYDGGGNEFFRGRPAFAFENNSSMDVTGGTETRGENTGLLPLLVI